MFAIRSADRTRFPRYYCGPKKPEDLKSQMKGRDSGPFGGVSLMVAYNTPDEAELMLAALQDLYLTNYKWNRAEVMGAVVVYVL